MTYAAVGKVRGLTADDVTNNATRAFLTNVEGSVIHYGDSTGFFADKMFSKGPSYLSAAVMYENLVAEANNSKNYPNLAYPVVAIYPKEGTFYSDHPLGVMQTQAGSRRLRMPPGARSIQGHRRTFSRSTCRSVSSSERHTYQIERKTPGPLCKGPGQLCKCHPTSKREPSRTASQSLKPLLRCFPPFFHRGLVLLWPHNQQRESGMTQDVFCHTAHEQPLQAALVSLQRFAPSITPVSYWPISQRSSQSQGVCSTCHGVRQPSKRSSTRTRQAPGQH